MNRRIIFYYESASVGGAQFLFVRLAEYLNEQGCNVGYICKQDAFLRKNLRSSDTIIFFDQDNLDSYNFTENDVIITVLSYIYKLIKLNISNDKVKVFFWDVHPFNYIEHMAFSFFYKKKSRISSFFKLIEKATVNKFKNNMELLSNNNSIAFMCKKNLEFNRDFFGFSITEQLVPICLTIPYKRYVNYSKSMQSDCLNIAWLSRLDKDKVALLNILLGSISKLNLINLKLYVIGEGQDEHSIRVPENVEVIFVGRITDQALDTFIINNIDCGFAVGTASLEFAKLAIPTFLVPGNDSVRFYQNVDTKYIPLHRVSDFDVAVEHYHKDQTLTLLQCLDLVQNHYEIMSNHVYDYVTDKHSINITASKLLQYSNETISTLNLIDKIYNVGLFECLLGRLKLFFKKIMQGA